jgi:hypothetical protein
MERRSTSYCALFALAALVVVFSWLSSMTATRNVSAPGSTTFADLRRRGESPPLTEAVPVVPSPAVRSADPAAVPAELPNRLKPETDPGESSRTGTRFRASESVTAACGQHELWNDCSKLNGFLERMRIEPSDPDWAPAAEARIKRAADEGERGQYRIRALECRRTRCVLEVASESQNAGIAYDAAFDDGMTEDVGTVASEDDPQTGIRTMVFVQIWQKRETLLADR